MQDPTTMHKSLEVRLHAEELALPTFNAPKLSIVDDKIWKLLH